MEMSQLQKQHVENWFNNNIPNKHCVSCNGVEWEINEEFVYFPIAQIHETGNKFKVDYGIIGVYMWCSNCGLSRLYHAAKILGLD